MSRCVMLNCLAVLQRSAFTAVWLWSSSNVLGGRGHSAFVHRCRLRIVTALSKRDEENAKKRKSGKVLG